ncbi:hypothetical protein BGZ63DRAFT_152719 [Mariannaea sp. PMI_226]|nr:hypothetical protein BGZ63DRAFT_152719 [Mariannaea sp. PMI_226]
MTAHHVVSQSIGSRRPKPSSRTRFRWGTGHREVRNDLRGAGARLFDSTIIVRTVGSVVSPRRFRPSQNCVRPGKRYAMTTRSSKPVEGNPNGEETAMPGWAWEHVWSSSDESRFVMSSSDTATRCHVLHPEPCFFAFCLDRMRGVLWMATYRGGALRQCS